MNENESLYLRRGRVILSGSLTDHLYVYAQADFTGSVGGNGLGRGGGQSLLAGSSALRSPELAATVPSRPST